MECSNAGEFIDLLLEAGADPNEKDGTGRTPLHYATRSGHCDTIIKLLLRKGANLDIKDKKGKTPIEFAVNNPNLNIKEYFSTDDVIHGTFRKKTQVDYNGKKYLCKSVNLWEGDFLLSEQNPDRYFGKLNEAQDINQLERFVTEAIECGVRFNLSCKGNIYSNTYESMYNFTDYVIRRISELEIFQVERDIEVASRIVCNLVSKGAVLETLSSIIVIDKLEKFKDHKANLKEARKSYIHYSLRFLEAAKNATTGKVKEAKWTTSLST